MDGKKCKFRDTVRPPDKLFFRFNKTAQIGWVSHPITVLRNFQTPLFSIKPHLDKFSSDG